ncbi:MULTISPECIES: tetratricopeptide repeat protein [Bacillus]|uniref:tetratricopeptide repeat protein n=1 Tax=Bacillus TaxID=1386 RepID=UPI000BB8D46D|nr:MULTISPECIES: tetratricopeptide repeat protein [Bacillus]
MKKDKQNIVQFPNLKQRLLEKAMETMKQKNFHDALKLFEEAQDFEFAPAEVELGIIVCLMETGDLQEAKQRCKRLLQEDIGDYFHTLQMYITILIQLKEYEEVKLTIEAILQEERIPAQQAQTFYQLLEFARKMLPYEEQSEKLKDETKDGQLQIDELINGDTQKQYMIIQQLKHLHVRPYKEYILNYLEDSNRHPVLKTFLLNVLMEQEWNIEVTVQKLSRTIKVKPIELNFDTKSSFLLSVESILDDKINSNNPTMFDTLQDMIVRLHAVLFPLTLEGENAKVWAAALHSLGNEYYGFTAELDHVALDYDVDINQLSTIRDTIVKLEEFSYLQL